MKKLFKGIFALGAFLISTLPMLASEANLVVPNIKEDALSYNLLLAGIAVAVIGAVFGLVEYIKIKKIQVHPVMEQVGATIFENCKTYLIQQGKFLILLEVLISPFIVLAKAKSKFALHNKLASVVWFLSKMS